MEGSASASMVQKRLNAKTHNKTRKAALLCGFLFLQVRQARCFPSLSFDIMVLFEIIFLISNKKKHLLVL